MNKYLEGFKMPPDVEAADMLAAGPVEPRRHFGAEAIAFLKAIPRMVEEEIIRRWEEALGRPLTAEEAEEIAREAILAMAEKHPTGPWR